MDRIKKSCVGSDFFYKEGRKKGEKKNTRVSRKGAGKKKGKKREDARLFIELFSMVPCSAVSMQTVFLSFYCCSFHFLCKHNEKIQHTYCTMRSMEQSTTSHTIPHAFLYPKSTFGLVLQTRRPSFS